MSNVTEINKKAREIVNAPSPKKATYAPGILSSSKSYLVDPRSVYVREGHNHRFDFGDVDALAAQIEVQYANDQVGVLVPLVVKRDAEQVGKFQLVAGERRLMAVTTLLKKGLEFPKGIPVEIMDKDTTEVQMRLRDIVMNSGKPLLPLEEANAFQWFKTEAGMTIEQIAAQTGRGLYHVHASLKLLNADSDVVDAVKDGTIGTSLGKDIATKVKDKSVQKEIVKAVKEAGNDKTKKKAAVKQAKKTIRESQERHAAARGKELKIRALTDEQLNEHGANVNKWLVDLLKDAGYKDNDELLKACESDDKLAAAFTLGALNGLKLAAGLKINLKL